MALSMLMEQVAIGLYANQAEIDAAVTRLLNVGIPVQDISVVGGVGPARDAAMGTYTPPKIVEHELRIEEEREGVLVGGALGLLVGFGIFVVAGIGSLLVLGPMAGLLAGAGLGVTLGDVFGGVTFYGVAADYRKQLVAGNYLVFVEFAPELQGCVKDILETNPPTEDSPQLQ